MSADTIRFEGVINNGDAQGLQRLIDSNVKRILVTSRGGYSVEAQQIGDIIERYNLEVSVQGYCMSACANSLFLRANRKVLSETVRIGERMYDTSGVACFHGGAIGRSDDALKDMVQFRASYMEDIKAGKTVNFHGRQIKSEADFDRYLELIRQTNSKELHFLDEKRISREILLLHKMMNVEMVCPNREGLLKLGVRGIEGDSPQFQTTGFAIYDGSNIPELNFSPEPALVPKRSIEPARSSAKNHRSIQ